jgi:hypothetical protein
MRRAAAVLGLLFFATPLFAFTGTPSGKRALRVGVLHTSDRWAEASYDSAAAAIEHEMAQQLRKAGLDAWDTHCTLEQIDGREDREADLYIEVSGGDARLREIGGIDIGTRHVATSIGVVVSKIAAEVRLYDGRSFELIDRFDLARSRTAVVPTSIGFGDRGIFAFAVLPVIDHFQYRAAVRDVAEDAARRIARR